MEDEKILSILSHILGILSGWVGPLILYLVLKDRKDLSAENSREALNFQLSLLIYYFASFILIFVLIGFFLIFLISILSLIFSIIGAVKASEGKVYIYPLTIRFLKE